MDLQYIFPLTGFISDKKLAIYGDDYRFSFIEINQKSEPPISIKPEDNLIRGYTHDGKQIAIMCEKDLIVHGSTEYKSSCFFYAIDNYMEVVTLFDTITFSGGILNNLFDNDALAVEHTQKGMAVHTHNNTISYSFLCKDEPVVIKIWSKVASSYGWNTGSKIESTDVNLTISFTEMKPFSYAIDCYHHICNCLRFMTNRYNVGINNTIISTQRNSDPLTHNKSFLVFFHKEYEYTTKFRWECMSFKDLGESFVQLYLMISTSTNTKMNYSFGFFPKDDRDVDIITNSKIRSICAALEFEAEEEPLVSPENNPELDELIKTTKKCIKHLRKKYKSISDSTYSRIFTNIKFWSFSARDKIEKLWNIHNDAMNKLSCAVPNGQITDIGTFVKYRNEITHGAEMEATKNVIDIAFVLRGLVYCCILKRIGVAEEQIVKLCERQINT